MSDYHEVFLLFFDTAKNKKGINNFKVRCKFQLFDYDMVYALNKKRKKNPANSETNFFCVSAQSIRSMLASTHLTQVQWNATSESPFRNDYSAFWVDFVGADKASLFS